MKKRILPTAITLIVMGASVPTYSMADGFFSKIFGGDKKEETEKESKQEKEPTKVAEKTNQKAVVIIKPKNESLAKIKQNITTREQFWDQNIDNPIIQSLLGYQALDTEYVNKAAEYFINASEYGLESAIKNTITIIEHGEVNKEIIQKSIPVLEKEAIKGNTVAQREIAKIYMNKDIVEDKDNEGAVWFKIAAESGDIESMYIYGNMLITGTKFERNGQLGTFYLTKMAESTNNPIAYRHIAQAYLNGMGLVKDYQKSLENFEKAAKYGDIYSMKKAGQMYSQGKGTKQNIEKALSLYKQAFERGDQQSGYLWASLYSESNSGNDDKAIEVLKQAGEQGYYVAYRYIGDIYKNRMNIQDNYAIAVDWYKKAASNNDTSSMRRLYNIYMEGGNGIEKDSLKAKEYLRQAITTKDNSIENTRIEEPEFKVYDYNKKLNQKK